MYFITSHEESKKKKNIREKERERESERERERERTSFSYHSIRSYIDLFTFDGRTEEMPRKGMSFDQKRATLAKIILEGVRIFFLFPTKIIILSYRFNQKEREREREREREERGEGGGNV